MLGMHRYLIAVCAEPVIVQRQKSNVSIIYLFGGVLLPLIRQTRHDDFKTMLEVAVLLFNSDTQHKK